MHCPLSYPHRLTHLACQALLFLLSFPSFVSVPDIVAGTMVQPIPVIALVRSVLRGQLPPRLSDVDRHKVSEWRAKQEGYDGDPLFSEPVPHGATDRGKFPLGMSAPPVAWLITTPGCLSLTGTGWGMSLVGWISCPFPTLTH